MVLKLYYSVVLWHGMGDNCCSSSMEYFTSLVRSHVPDVYIKSLMIGSSPDDDADNGFFMPIKEQVEFACDLIKNDPELANGYNAIGISQGGLFLRGVAQTCPGMKTLVSIGAPQQGMG